jgi:hypothetical protein
VEINIMNQVEHQYYNGPPNPEKSLEKLAQRLSKLNILKSGYISFRLTGLGGGDYFLHCNTDHVQVSQGIPRTAPIIEIIGDATRVQAVLEGRKDARKQFYAGAFRVRGHLRYLSDLALELGIIASPL